MKRRFEMTQADLDELLDACRPVPYMVFGGIPPRSPQENANAAWQSLGARMGFDAMTVEQIPGADQKCFLAEPVEQESPSLSGVS